MERRLSPRARRTFSPSASQLHRPLCSEEAKLYPHRERTHSRERREWVSPSIAGGMGIIVGKRGRARSKRSRILAERRKRGEVEWEGIVCRYAGGCRTHCTTRTWMEWLEWSGERSEGLAGDRPLILEVSAWQPHVVCQRGKPTLRQSDGVECEGRVEIGKMRKGIFFTVPWPMRTIRSMASTGTHSGSAVSGSRSTTFLPTMESIPDLGAQREGPDTFLNSKSLVPPRASRAELTCDWKST